MINWLKREKVKPIHLMAGDSITASYNDGRRHERVSSQVTKTMVVDHIGVGEFEDELGFKEGMVGVFGRE